MNPFMQLLMRLMSYYGGPRGMSQFERMRTQRRFGGPGEVNYARTHGPSQWNNSLWSNPMNPTSNYPLGPDAYRQFQALLFSNRNPGWAGRDPEGLGPFGGDYGFAGITRGSNPDPRLNPFVGDYSWLGADPAGGRRGPDWGSSQQDRWGWFGGGGGGIPGVMDPI